MIRPPPRVGILRPMIQWNITGIDAIMNVHRFSMIFIEIEKLLSERSKAAIEANGQQAIDCFLSCLLIAES